MISWFKPDPFAFTNSVEILFYPLIVISSKVLTENHSLVFSLTIYFKALNLIAKIVKIDNFDRWLAHRSLL